MRILFSSRIVSWKQLPVFPYAFLFSQILFLVAGTFTRNVTFVLPKLVSFSPLYPLYRSLSTRLRCLIACICTALVVKATYSSALLVQYSFARIRSLYSTFCPKSFHRLIISLHVPHLEPYSDLIFSISLYISLSYSYLRRRDVLI